MAIKYYDDAISQKIRNYISDPEIRVLRPEETRELFKMRADINDDKPLAFPMNILLIIVTILLVAWVIHIVSDKIYRTLVPLLQFKR